ncbi:hypothetical protein HDF18_13010 [Mucilaginibacter sp. X5P1]|uniref:hypothetical protein n=1 Tax=Mucilaginibacter sp. X5P1 TaxID=2723088 RepID=UPI0016201270|nr:hypothetical protein [Mucilaginibacter sp. X5P1]MBB6141742.1 hypothetical protein [Mucilaginibacter sp. X5P1]
MKLILNSSVAKTVTGLLLVFLSQYNTVKSYWYTLQKMLDGDNTGPKAVINQTTIISTYVKPGGYIISLLNLSSCLTP